MITEEEKLIINETETKMELKKIFIDLTSSMIEYYDKNYLTKKELKYDIREAWMLTMIKAKDIDFEYFKVTSLNQSNIISEKINNINSTISDPADKEKITALEKEIKELKETIELIEKKMLDTKSRNYKLLNQISDLEENAAPGEAIQNPRGAGRKPKITPEQIAMIQMLRAQGKTLQEIQAETNISYGNIQKYCKLITDNKKRAGL